MTFHRDLLKTRWNIIIEITPLFAKITISVFIFPRAKIRRLRNFRFLPNLFPNVTLIRVLYYPGVCLVTGLLSGNEAGVDTVLIQTSVLFIRKHKLVSVRKKTTSKRKTVRIVSEQRQLQPRFHSKARSLSTQL